MASTPHTCTYVPPNKYSSCDRGGCGTNIHNVDANAYCPDGHCTINTSQKFNVSHTQGVGGGVMNDFKQSFKQGSKSYHFDACSKGDYLKWMGMSLHGIVFAASLWGGPNIDMHWLDGMTGCQEHCNLGGASVTWSNFKLESNKSASQNPWAALQ